MSGRFGKLGTGVNWVFWDRSPLPVGIGTFYLEAVMVEKLERSRRRPVPFTKESLAKLAEYHKKLFDFITMHKKVSIISRLLTVTSKYACLNPAKVPNGSGGTTVRACGITGIGGDGKGVCSVCDLVCKIVVICSDLTKLDPGEVPGPEAMSILFRLSDASIIGECLAPVKSIKVRGSYSPILFRCGKCAVCVLCDEALTAYSGLKKALFGLDDHEKLE